MIVRAATLIELSEFDYELPEELIAQRPLERREDSRMLALDRAARRWEDRRFAEFPSFLRSGDCLVLNNSRVIPSRLYGNRAGRPSGRVEVLLLEPVQEDRRDWRALVRPGRKMRVGEIVEFGAGLKAEIIGRGELGERTLRFDGDVDSALERIGHIPLPPYIRRPDEEADRERYQTVYAREKGSVAAPTAGLHFTPEILEACRAAGAEIAYLTLHVGRGTFQPIRADRRLHAEHYEVTPENAAKIRAASRLLAVGTTSVRTLETMARGGLRGETELFIQPGFDFALTGAMLTNFHLPRTSLLLLVSAFAGVDFARAAYRHAVAERYRFYSYGDCMLIV